MPQSTSTSSVYYHRLTFPNPRLDFRVPPLSTLVVGISADFSHPLTFSGGSMFGPGGTGPQILPRPPKFFQGNLGHSSSATG